MTYGLTDAGFVRKTLSNQLVEFKAELRDRIAPNLRLDEKTYLGNLIVIVAEAVDEACETLEALVGALDVDNAVGPLLTGLCKLTGVVQAQATYGTVLVDVEFAQTKTIAAGDLAIAVDGSPENIWQNTAVIVGTAGGTVEGAPFRSLNTGSQATAAAGALTVIVSGGTGLASVTNPADATPGADAETQDELRLRRARSLARAGRATVAAVQAAILTGIDGEGGVEGVVDCKAIENDSSVEVDGQPAQSLRVLIWDGVGEDADDDTIAQTIYDSKAGGVTTWGSESGTAQTPWSTDRTVYFDRMTGVEITVEVEVTGDTSESVVQQAILDYSNSIDQGESIVWSKVFAAASGAAGVDDVISLTLQRDADPPVSTNIAMAIDEKALFDLARINVTIS